MGCFIATNNITIKTNEQLRIKYNPPFNTSICFQKANKTAAIEHNSSLQVTRVLK